MLRLCILCAALSLVVQSFPAAPLTGPLAASLIGVNAHTATNPDVLRELNKAGISWIRDDLPWAGMETSPGRYNFSTGGWEECIRTARELGMGVIAIAGSNNPLYDGGEPIHSAAGILGLANWITAVADHWSDAPAWWELVNEPNGGGGYGGNASLYASITAMVGAMVRAKVPNATLVGPAVENIDMEWLKQVFEGGVLHHFDAVTIHPYRSDGPETMPVDYGKVRQLVNEYAPLSKTPMPVVVGEWGYGAATVGSITEQAHLFARMQIMSGAFSASPAIWYEACDPDVGEGGMGIMNCTNGGAPFQPLPPYTAAQTLHTVLRNDDRAPGSPIDPTVGFRFVTRLPAFQNGMNTDDDWVMLYKSRAGHVMLAAWTSAEFMHVLRIPGVEQGDCFQQIATLGEKLSEICHDGRGLHVNVTGAPVYLVQTTHV